MASDFSLFCCYRNSLDLRIIPIRVLPSTNVYDCTKLILREVREVQSASLPYSPKLYRIPQERPVPLNDINSTLGALSVSDLEVLSDVSLSIQDLFGPRPGRRVHLVLVDRGVSLPVVFWIPRIQGHLRVNAKEEDTVDSFLPAIKEKYPALKQEVNFSFYNTPCNEFGDYPDTTTKDRPLHGFASLFLKYNDIPFSKFPCVTVEVAHQERKHKLSWENAKECAKRRKLLGLAPSSIDVRAYRSIQTQSSERMLDYRQPVDYDSEPADAKLPPIEVLFDGFGKFLDIWRAASMTSFKPDSETLDMNVDEFVNVMSQIFADETDRSKQALKLLNKTFPCGGGRSAIIPREVPRTGTTGADSPPRTDGFSLYRDDIPCIVVELKNEDGSGKAIPIAELVAYYNLQVHSLCVDKEAVVNGSRLPTLGITIVGPAITFFALAYVGSPIYVPLTPSLWCLPVECGGSDRYQLYVAFKAASVLLESIEKEAKRITDSPPARIRRPEVPQFGRLRRHNDVRPLLSPSESPLDDSEYIDFEITELVCKDFNRHVYAARSSASHDGVNDLIIKLTRSYSPELHALCARLGYAPKLYACEKLAGGFFAVAMEFLDGGQLVSPSDLALQEKWADDLQGMVNKIHELGYVHGDLRPPNIMCVQDRLVVLDFDWGGKDGKAHYPHTRLNPLLKAGRDMSRLEITKEDDKRILKATVDYIHGKDV